MDKTLCQRCFHYAACAAIDLSGAIGNPEMENEPCDHFIDAERVKIQDKANWIEKIFKYKYNGRVHVCYYCTHCNQFEHVDIYTYAEWDNYYSEHYRDNLKLPNFCNVCGSVIDGIIEDSGD